MNEQNPSAPLTAGRYMRTLKMLHTALLAGMMLFAAVVVILLGTKSMMVNTSGADMHQVLQFVMPVVCVAGFLGGNFMFKQRLDAANSQGGSLLKRLLGYRTASIMRWAMLEAPVLLAIIGLMLTGKYLFYGPFIFVMLVFFLMYAPNEEKIKVQLRMSSSEQAVLDDEYGELQ